MPGPIIAASIGAIVTICGWFVTYAYSKRLENRRRRLEAHLQYRSQQIEQLYGPLLGLIEQITNVYRVRKTILQTCRCSPQEATSISEIIWKRYFTPLHGEIAALLRTKLYLLEENELPPSFVAYLEHARQEEFQHLLRDELHIDTSGVPPRKWPKDFQPDVEGTLKRLMEDRRHGLSQLGVSSAAKPA